MNYVEKIEEILNETLTEKTFNLEIIGKIKTLKDDFQALQETNKKQEDLLTERYRQIEVLTGEKTKLTAKVEGFEKREHEISLKEKELDKNKYELEFQRNRAIEIKELFGIVFRNPVIKESAFRTVPITTESGGYTSVSDHTSSDDKTITTE